MFIKLCHNCDQPSHGIFDICPKLEIHGPLQPVVIILKGKGLIYDPSKQAWNQDIAEQSELSKTKAETR